MKPNSMDVLCLLLLLFHTPFLLAKKGSGGGFGKSFSFKKSSPSNRGTSHTNTAKKHNQGSTSHGGYPKQHGQNNQGGYPGGARHQGYPQQGGGGYYNHYPGGGSPYGRGGYGGYGGHGGYTGYGGYPGGYINQNPNNKILSPHYGGSFGYGGYGARGGSPFSQSVQSQGYYPSPNSKGFGRSAVMAAAGGAVAGMALGYGLGRFPRPNFQFHNPQEEYYYNQYMYKKYGTKSSDTNDYSRDYSYNPTPQTYDSYIDSCMKRTDLLPTTNQKPKYKPVASSITSAESTKSDTVASAADGDTSNNTTKTNSSAAENPSTSASSTPRLSSQPEASPVPPASPTDNSAEDDDTVSIVEIGYPALIEQLKVRRCVELYLVYSERYLMKQTGGAQGLNMGFQGLLAVVFSTVLMLINSSVLMSLH